MAVEAKYGELDIKGIPAGEPVFVLRARDLTALEMLRAYVQMCEHAGSPQSHLDAIGEVREAFSTWRAEHADEVKVPDTETAASSA